jgi:general stress protein YciG
MVKIQRMSPKDQAAVSLGRKGGKATARNRTPEERAEAARKAVQARWAKQDKLVAEITQGTKELLKTARVNARAAARRAKQKGAK